MARNLLLALVGASAALVSATTLADEDRTILWLMASIGTNVVDDAQTNRLTLDQIAPDHPVLLAAWYGHGTYINTKAMQIVGIGEEEADPFGGFYERLPNSRVITGAA
jgi:predicted amidohydrolase YtcJ